MNVSLEDTNGTPLLGPWLRSRGLTGYWLGKQLMAVGLLAHPRNAYRYLKPPTDPGFKSPSRKVREEIHRITLGEITHACWYDPETGRPVWQDPRGDAPASKTREAAE